METYRGHVRNPNDAIKLFEACRLGLLPRVQRRLSEKERQSIQSGSVFVWDEREAGMRRWTDGKSWSASRVSGSFLTYREMEGKRGGGNFVPAPRRLGGKTPDSGRGSDEDADMDADGPDGYRYKADGLMKQSFSITTSTGQHLHLISYYTPRPHSTMADLPQPTTDPALRHIVPVKGMYPESTVNDSAPSMRTAPMPTSYMSLGQQIPVGPPPQALGRAPYPYPQGYGPWPPSPMATPPYNYPSAMYASQLPLPANGHPISYPQHPQYLPPHLQHHISPQSYDRPSPLGPLTNTHDPSPRFPGPLPQMSAQPYGPSSYNGGERHLSEPSIQQRPMAYMNQMPGVDNRLPPPLQHQNSAPQQSQTNCHHLQREPSSQAKEQTSQQSQQSPRLNAILNNPKMDQATSIPSISNLVHAAEGPDASVPVPAASARQPSPAPIAQEATPQPQRLASPGAAQLSNSTRRISLVDAQQIAQATDAVRKAATPTRESASPATVATIETPTGARTPETASAETTEAATPKEAGAPQDIPHEKLSFPGGAGAEDMRAIRVLDRKFCI